MGIYYLSTVSTFERLQLQVKFGDVAGCDGAKTELVEVVDFLKNASRWGRDQLLLVQGTLNWTHFRGDETIQMYGNLVDVP